MHVDFFGWDDEADPTGNTRHIISAGYDPGDIEDAILGYVGMVETTRKTRRPMIRATQPDGEAILIIFEIEASDGFVVVTPITAFPRED